MNFLLTFFYLSPGQAPNWKTETQTGVGKPVLPRESTGASGHRRKSKRKRQPAFPRPSLLFRPPDPRKILLARQLPDILSVGRFSTHSEKENGEQPLQTAKTISWQLSNHTFKGLDVFKIFLQQSLHFLLLFMLFFWKGHRT